MRLTSYLAAALVLVQLVTLEARAQQGSAAHGQQRHCDTLVLHFGFNQENLRQEDAARLEKVFHNPGFVIDTLVITGYTDTAGTSSYNQRLSLRRAQSAAGYIEKLPGAASLPGSTLSPGVASLPVMFICGKGEEAPIAGSDSLNRRVVVIWQKVAAAGSAKPDTVISLTNINFIEDSPNLTEASRMIIPGYVRLLKRYKADSLEIDGYCHSLTPITSTSDPLFQLSVKRAKFIFDYLVDEGFDRTKLSYKGMGNASPKNPHPVTAEEARANMRVEIRVYHKTP